MPRYSFRVPFQAEPIPVDLTDDDEAWSEAVTYIGELLRDIDGRLASPARLAVRVTERDREVAAIEVSAARGRPSG